MYVALRFFALGLVGHSCLELVARTFFAQKDTVTPLLVAAGSAGLNIALGVILMVPLAHGGLALANSIAVTAEVGVLLVLLNRRLEGLEGRETLGVLVRVTAASVVMAIVIGATQQAAGRAGAGELMAACWLRPRRGRGRRTRSSSPGRGVVRAHHLVQLGVAEFAARAIS